jgi:uncharacterized protein (DUF1697 family)
VVFRASRPLLARLPADVSGRLAADHGLEVPVVVRTARELDAVVRQDPFADERHPDARHVAFLADRPRADRVARLDPARSPSDRFVVRGREIYLWAPHGLARTRLTNDWFDRELQTTSTVRNWRTVLALCALARTPA